YTVGRSNRAAAKRRIGKSDSRAWPILFEQRGQTIMSTQLRSRIALKTAAHLLAKQSPALSEREQTLLAIIDDLAEAEAPVRAKSVDSLREQVRAAALEDSRFNTPAATNDNTVTFKPDI